MIYHHLRSENPRPRFSSLRHAVVALSLSCLLLLGCGGDPAPKRSDSPQSEATSKQEKSSQKKVDSTEHRPAITISSPAPGTLLAGEKLVVAGSGIPLDSALHFRLIYDSVLTISSGDLSTPRKDSSAERVSFSRTVNWHSDWEGEAVLEVYEIDTVSGKEIGHARVSVLLPPVPEGDSVRTIYAYFPNRRIGSRSDCGLVFPLVRTLPGESRSLARGAVYYLLKGVTTEEREGNYFDRTPRGLRLESIEMKDRVAHLDFSSHLNRSRRSCQSETIRAQIEQTIAQFMTVDAVVIRANGRLWTAGRR